MKKPSFRNLVSLLLLVLLPVSSYATFVPVAGHVYKLVCRASGAVLEVGDTDQFRDKHAINEWPYYSNANQQWLFESSGGNSYQIKNRYTGKYMGLSNLNGRTAQSEYQYGPNNAYYEQNVYKGGTFINQFYQYSGAYQDWELMEVPGTFSYESSQSYFQIVNVHSGKVLENMDGSAKRGAQEIRNGVAYDIYSYAAKTSVSGLWTWQRESNPGSLNQQYDIVDVTPNPYNSPDFAQYRIVNAERGTAITCWAQGQEVHQASPVNDYEPFAVNQQWSLRPTYAGSGEFYIINRLNGQVLEIGGGHQVPGSTLNIWTNYSHPWQRWSIYEAHDQYGQYPITAASQLNGGTVYKIVSAYAGKVIELPGSVPGPTAIPSLWHDYAYDDSQNRKQQWFFQLTSYNRSAPGNNTTVASNSNSTTTARATALSAAQQSLQLYPSPARETITLSADGQTEWHSVVVTDMRGAVTSARYLGNGITDVAGLAPGVYLLTAEARTQRYHQKFVKE